MLAASRGGSTIGNPPEQNECWKEYSDRRSAGQRYGKDNTWALGKRSRRGLPHRHLPYVRNVKPGMPLFLFNSDDRKLHGIFMATSPGQLNIDRFAWMSVQSNATATPFPAQVRFTTKTQCTPLPENKYKSVIIDNYSKKQLGYFYFELNHAQTRNLISLFAPSPVRAIRNKPIILGPPATTHTVPNAWDRPLPYLKAKAHVLSDQVKSEHNVSNLDKDASDYDDLAGSIKEDKESENDDQHAKMAFPLKPQELSSLQQKGSHSLEDAPVSSKAQCIRQDTWLAATLTKDSSNATSQCDISLKDNTSSVQCHGYAEHQIISNLSKTSKAMEKKQIDSDQGLLLKELVKGDEIRVEQLEQQYGKLQFEHNSSAPLFGVTHSNVEEPAILLSGGHDGINWLSSLDSYCPATDILETLRPMSSARAYMAVATLKDHVCIFGGWNGIHTLLYNTVECYNKGGNKWIALPRLNRKKGFLAGATLNDRIFAIGGGAGSRSFSEVEMFDPAVGKWMYSLSMQQPRLAPAAAELNGVLYVTGGFDGNISAERYDPREGFWTQLPSMGTRRGSHSVVVLRDSLYALGGQDRNTMLSSVEIFDTHANSWRVGSPLSVPRAFGCAVAVDGNAYLLGGIQGIGEYVETVEVYKEGQGWSVSGSKAVGKRAFACAVAI
uniref:DCD domain-containing protein n=1 Tax=Leersia perrieri TaxID=77586 RepID=A0A0D9UX50_9ORYZ